MKTAKERFETGESYRVLLNGFRDTVKAHIIYVLPSEIHEGKNLIVFKYWLKHKGRWIEAMLREDRFSHSIEMGN